MNTVELVRTKLQSLPPSVQQEVLDFVEFLARKCPPVDEDWSTFSLSAALAGMEDEQWPEYTDDDYLERWR